MVNNELFILKYGLNMTNKKTIIIDSSVKQRFYDRILAETFYPIAEQVNLVKDFLDKNFQKRNLDSIDSNGYPTKEKSVTLMSGKQELKSMNMEELLRMLDDKFHNLISDDADRKKFLKQVIIDWYNNNIKDGILSLNFL